jgi:hypothetical protein
MDNESVDAGSTIASNSIGETERGCSPEKTGILLSERPKSVIPDNMINSSPSSGKSTPKRPDCAHPSFDNLIKNVISAEEADESRVLPPLEQPMSKSPVDKNIKADNDLINKYMRFISLRSF